MTVVSKEELAGIWLNPGQEDQSRSGDLLACSECLSDEEWGNLRLKQSIKWHQVSEDPDSYYFCDRCEKRMWR